MTAPAFVTPQIVRDYLTLDTDSTSRYTDATINSNIRTASEFLERATNRYFAQRTGVTLTLSSNGDAMVDLPGVRSITSVTQAGNALVANQTFWLLPDTQQSGAYTGLQLRAFTGRSPWYLSSPEWFDRNLDSPYNPANLGYGYGAVPNDLVIVADVGYAPADYPEGLMMSCKILAAILTLSPNTTVTGAAVTPDGNATTFITDGASFVNQFISDWKIGTHSAVSL